MSKKLLLESGAQISALSHRLECLGNINRYDGQDHKECGALSCGLGHIEDSCHKILNEWLPQLMVEDASEEEVYDKLEEIAFEIRHILWHADDSRYLKEFVF